MTFLVKHQQIAAILLALTFIVYANPLTSQEPTVLVEDEVKAIFAKLDNRAIPPADLLKEFTTDAVILPPNELEIRGSEKIKIHLKAAAQQTDLVMHYQIVELSDFHDIVVVQGKVIGTVQQGSISFETKNLIIFKRQEPNLKIWKVIYNAAPLP
jgi:ketosteroid isomerase-like protein